MRKRGSDSGGTLRPGASEEFGGSTVKENLQYVSNDNEKQADERHVPLPFYGMENYVINMVLSEDPRMDAENCNTQDELADCTNC